MTDERLYRDSQSVSASGIARARGHDPVHGDDAVGSRYFVERGLLERSEAQAANRLGRSPSILGSEQTRWWKATLKSSSATWKVWGNEVMLNRLWVDLPSKQDGSTSFVVNGDSWDGYPAHRHELLAWLSQQAIRNIVAITGDLHAGCLAKTCRARASASWQALSGRSTENASAKSARPYDHLSCEAGGKSDCSTFG